MKVSYSRLTNYRNNAKVKHLGTRSKTVRETGMTLTASEVLNLAKSLLPWKQVGDLSEKIKGHGVALVKGEKWQNPRTGEVMDIDYCQKGNGVTVVPITQEGHVVLTLQTKPVGGLVIGFPSGLDKGDEVSAVEHALKELQQEAGLKVGRLEKTSPQGVRFAPMKVDTTTATFVALGCEMTMQQELEEGESDITVVVVTQTDLMMLLRAGVITGDSMVAALNAYLNGYIDI